MVAGALESSCSDTASGLSQVGLGYTETVSRTRQSTGTKTNETECGGAKDGGGSSILSDRFFFFP